MRFIQIMHPTWDDHSDLNKKLKKNCDITDRPTAALLKDLKQRGLLDSTLVIWGSEFGRTPLIQTLGIAGESWGRDHHPNAFTMWMAGGGIKPGQVVGKTGLNHEFGLDSQWDSDKRLHVLEDVGVVAEILFPNGLPFQVAAPGRHGVIARPSTRSPGAAGLQPLVGRLLRRGAGAARRPGRHLLR